MGYESDDVEPIYMNFSGPKLKTSYIKPSSKRKSTSDMVKENFDLIYKEIYPDDYKEGFSLGANCSSEDLSENLRHFRNQGFVCRVRNKAVNLEKEVLKDYSVILVREKN